MVYGSYNYIYWGYSAQTLRGCFPAAILHKKIEQVPVLAQYPV
jgi:hypothetical protein